MKLDCSVHFFIMGIVAKTKQNKIKTLQEEVRKIPSGDAELIAGVWIYARWVLALQECLCQYKLLF